MPTESDIILEIVEDQTINIEIVDDTIVFDVEVSESDVAGREVQLRKGTTHIQYRYDGDVSWTDLIAISDLKGEQGIQGIQGEKGDTGATGAQGAQGIQGIQGVKGDKGDTGDAGADGTNGVDGQDGVVDYSRVIALATVL